MPHEMPVRMDTLLGQLRVESMSAVRGWKKLPRGSESQTFRTPSGDGLLNIDHFAPRGERRLSCYDTRLLFVTGDDWASIGHVLLDSQAV